MTFALKVHVNVAAAMDVLWLKTLESSHQHQLDLVRPSPEF